MKTEPTTPKKVLKSKWRWTLIGLFLLMTVFVKAYTTWYWPKAEIVLGGQTLNVLVAKYPWQWEKGLGDRKALGKYDGMLFLFPKVEQHAMVMRDMRFPLDIVWLSRGTVVDIAPNVPIQPNVPEEELRVYMGRLPSNMVLELPAGKAKEWGLKIGDKLSVRP